LASSAPILYFPNSPDATPYAFNDLIAESFDNVTEGMSTITKEGWDYIVNAVPADYGVISSIFKTCDPITSSDDLYNLYYHLMNGYAYMAMTDYPYYSEFLEPMPGYPVNVAAAFFY